MKRKYKIRDPVGKMSSKDGTRETQTATRGLAIVLLWRHLKNAKRSVIVSIATIIKPVATDCGDSAGIVGPQYRSFCREPTSITSCQVAQTFQGSLYS